MVKIVWKKLPKQDIDKLLAHVRQIDERERPLYGLVGNKRNEALSWILITLNKPHILYLTKDRIILSRRSAMLAREKSRKEYAITDLAGVDIRTGPLLESVGLTFRDGFKIRLRDVPKTQSEPLHKMLTEGVTAFAPEKLSDEQITNCYYAFHNAKLIPPDLLG